MRLDVFLVEHGYALSRQRAKLLVDSGCVFCGGIPAKKAAQAVSDTDVIEVRGTPFDYVSRGALKLKAAFEAFSLSADGCTALDIGASTGGFTEYLLERGARLVYAVDSGSGQLAEKLLRDARVISMEKYNARLLDPKDFPKTPTFAVMDVSFISQTLILPAAARVLAPRSVLVSLIKPQFEAGREYIGKGGIVRSAAARVFAIQKVLASAAEIGFAFCGLTASPITGGDGNIEYLSCFSKGDALPAVSGALDDLILQTVGQK